MIEIDVLQGSEEWHKARTGIPTASHFSKIITPKTLKLSAESDHYENRLVAERLTGCPCDDFKGSYW
ncbi:MAG: exonuclease, partial [Patescibacteria group bacterium]|nr:exonuclease [Patescibacteria group bacterium]